MNYVTIRWERSLWPFPFWRTRKVERTIPSSWDEVPPYLSAKVIRHLLGRDPEEAWPHILKELLEIPIRRYRLLDWSQLLALVDLIKWMKLDNISATPIFPSFKHNGRTYFLPKAKFENGQAIEYPLADEFYDKFFSEKKDDHLLHLTAVLCREATADRKLIDAREDIRVPLVNRQQVYDRADRLRSLSREYQVGVLMYFAGVKQLIYNMYGRYLFSDPEEITEEDKLKGVKPKEGPMFGWWGNFMDIAENGIYGDYNQVLQTNFHQICMYMAKKKKAADETKEEMRKARNKK